MEDCIFCKIIKGEAKSWKVYEDDLVTAFFDINVASEGHTLIVPKKHYENIYDIPERELCELMKVTKKLAVKYKDKLKINNVQILHSSGKEAQQDVFHFHLHLVPRHKGDDLDLSYKSHSELNKNFDKLLEKLKK